MEFFHKERHFVVEEVWNLTSEFVRSSFLEVCDWICVFVPRGKFSESFKFNSGCYLVSTLPTLTITSGSQGFMFEAVCGSWVHQSFSFSIFYIVSSAQHDDELSAFSAWYSVWPQTFSRSLSQRFSFLPICVIEIMMPKSLWCQTFYDIVRTRLQRAINDCLDEKIHQQGIWKMINSFECLREHRCGRLSNLSLLMTPRKVNFLYGLMAVHAWRGRFLLGFDINSFQVAFYDFSTSILW